MDEKDWIFLKILHEEKSITRTAERLYISQPALSYRLKNIEAEFGVALFFKTKKGIEFTSEGDYLVGYAVDMQRQLQQTKDHVMNMNNGVNGTLRLGVSSNFARYKLPEILKRFSIQYPNIQFNLNTGWSTEIMGLLDSSKVQVGIVRNNYQWKGEKSLLSKERVYLISKREITMDELPDLPFINYHTDNSLKNLINDWWHDHFSSPPRITMEVDKLETCKEMVKNDLGVAIIPEMSLQPNDHLHMLSLTDKQGILLQRNTWLMYDATFLNLSVVKAFVEFLNNES
ncbi:LysR family transcriptional regulator [Bacillus sp. Soil768D1]|nr:LysR family transcriptional regulator [Bacillus sp. Soil768D1]